jgi:hypothetical protein
LFLGEVVEPDPLEGAWMVFDREEDLYEQNQLREHRRVERVQVAEAYDERARRADAARAAAEAACALIAQRQREEADELDKLEKEAKKLVRRAERKFARKRAAKMAKKFFKGAGALVRAAYTFRNREAWSFSEQYAELRDEALNGGNRLVHKLFRVLVTKFPYADNSAAQTKVMCEWLCRNFLEHRRESSPLFVQQGVNRDENSAMVSELSFEAAMAAQMERNSERVKAHLNKAAFERKTWWQRLIGLDKTRSIARKRDF